MNKRPCHLLHVEHLMRGVLGLKAATTVASWKARKSIPVKHWPRVVSAARERGLDDVSYENLVSMHAEQVASAKAILEGEVK